MRNSQNRLRKKGERLAAIVIAALYILFGILAPALHRHDAIYASITGKSAPVVTRTAAPAASASLLQPGHRSGGDDCVLCQWLTGTAGALVALPILLLPIIALRVRLLLAARLAALCARPAPRRGLRAPPVFALAA